MMSSRYVVGRRRVHFARSDLTRTRSSAMIFAIRETSCLGLFLGGGGTFALDRDFLAAVGSTVAVTVFLSGCTTRSDRVSTRSHQLTRDLLVSFGVSAYRRRVCAAALTAAATQYCGDHEFVLH